MAHFNPYDWSFHEDPYPVYKQLREEAPVYYNEEFNFYALSRYRDVESALKNWQVFSNKAGVALEDIKADPAKIFFILGMDPPRQTVVRGILRKVFTPRRVAELVPVLQEMSQSYINDFAESGDIDFIEDFAGKIPMDLISEMIGVPKEDRDMIRGWANDLMERIDCKPDVPEKAIEGSINLLGYFGDMVKNKKRGLGGEDLTSAVLEAQLDGESLSEQDVVSFLFLMSVAGNETTTKLLANALYWGQKNRDQFAKVQNDPGRISDWVEETARFDPSSQILYRVSNSEFTLHDVTIPEGSKVAMLIASANRDQRVIKNPDIYDIDRDLSNTLSFGKGVHFCLGAALARMEGRVCLEELFKVYKDFEVDESSLARVHSGNVRGFSNMNVRFIKC